MMQPLQDKLQFQSIHVSTPSSCHSPSSPPLFIAHPGDPNPGTADNSNNATATASPTTAPFPLEISDLDLQQHQQQQQHHRLFQLEGRSYTPLGAMDSSNLHQQQQQQQQFAVYSQQGSPASGLSHLLDSEVMMLMLARQAEAKEAPSNWLLDSFQQHPPLSQQQQSQGVPQQDEQRHSDPSNAIASLIQEQLRQQQLHLEYRQLQQQRQYCLDDEVYSLDNPQFHHYQTPPPPSAHLSENPFWRIPSAVAAANTTASRNPVPTLGGSHHQFLSSPSPPIQSPPTIRRGSTPGPTRHEGALKLRRRTSKPKLMKIAGGNAEDGTMSASVSGLSSSVPATTTLSALGASPLARSRSNVSALAATTAGVPASSPISALFRSTLNLSLASPRPRATGAIGVDWASAGTSPSRRQSFSGSPSGTAMTGVASGGSSNIDPMSLWQNDPTSSMEVVLAEDHPQHRQQRKLPQPMPLATLDLASLLSVNAQSMGLASTPQQHSTLPVNSLSPSLTRSSAASSPSLSSIASSPAHSPSLSNRVTAMGPLLSASLPTSMSGMAFPAEFGLGLGQPLHRQQQQPQPQQQHHRSITTSSPAINTASPVTYTFANSASMQSVSVTLKPMVLPPLLPCPIAPCPKSFARTWNLETHLRTVHNIVKGSSPSEDKETGPSNTEDIPDETKATTTTTGSITATTASTNVDESGDEEGESTVTQIGDSLSSPTTPTMATTPTSPPPPPPPKPFGCHLCSRVFSRKHDLQRHIRVHTGSKPYVCMNCQKAFARTDALCRHYKVEDNCRRLAALLDKQHQQQQQQQQLQQHQHQQPYQFEQDPQDVFDAATALGLSMSMDVDDSRIIESLNLRSLSSPPTPTVTPALGAQNPQEPASSALDRIVSPSPEDFALSRLSQQQLFQQQQLRQTLKMEARELQLVQQLHQSHQLQAQMQQQVLLQQQRQQLQGQQQQQQQQQQSQQELHLQLLQQQEQSFLLLNHPTLQHQQQHYHHQQQQRQQQHQQLQHGFFSNSPPL